MILDVLRALGRRWYVVLLGFAITAGLVYGATRISPPEYNTRALIVLLPGQNAVVEGGNPFLALSGLEQPGSIVVAYFASATAQEQMADVSDSAEFTVALDSSTRGPVIAIDVTDTTAESATAGLEFLLSRVPSELARLQEGVGAPADSIITSMPLVVDAAPEVDTSGTVRLAIAAGAAGIAATGLLAFALDGMLLRRRVRRSRWGLRRQRGRGVESDVPDRHDEPVDDDHVPERRAFSEEIDEPTFGDPQPVPARAGHAN